MKRAVLFLLAYLLLALVSYEAGVLTVELLRVLGWIS